MKQIINISSNGIKQAIDDLVNENELLQDKVYKLEEQLQQKENIIKELDKQNKELGTELSLTIDKYEKKLFVKENIIKEVREYLNKNEIEEVYLDCKLYETKVYKNILEILDKEVN